MIDIRTVSGRLGERDYEIREAGFSASKVWKKRLMAEVKPLFNTFSDAPNMTFETPADLMNLFPLVESIFVDGIETIFDLLLEYAPALKADQEYIETNATDHQIVSLFREVVLLTDPFGIVAQLSPKIGPPATSTLSNLPLANGVSA